MASKLTVTKENFFEPTKRATICHLMSGAATWVKQDGNPLVWAARFNFGGICANVWMKGYSHRKNEPVVEVIKASVVRWFLEKTFGPS
jgi:hypothetical protein